jgi:uncharacterized membrane protein
MSADISLGSGPRTPAAPPFPTSSVELVNATVHYYRGEMGRMTSWRDRLDRTTNWAIAASAAMLSVSLSNPESHHGVLLFAMVLVFLLMVIESRRYRFFHCYRTRVRLMERNYFAQIFSPLDPLDPAPWLAQLAEDLRLPRFTMSLHEAMSRRLRRNYGWVFVILLLAWVLKITSRRLQPREGAVAPIRAMGSLLDNASIGLVPGWAVVASIVLFYGAMLIVALRYRRETGELGYGEVHV